MQPETEPYSKMKPSKYNYIVKAGVKDAAIGMFKAGEINTGAIYLMIKDQMNVVLPNNGLTKEDYEMYILEAMPEAMKN